MHLLLGRCFLDLLESRSQAIPGLGASGPHLPQGLKLARVIQTCSPQSLKVRDKLRLDKDGRAALRTKPPAHLVATLRPDVVILALSCDGKRRFRDVEHRAKRAATRPLAIPTVTIPGENGVSRTLIANRAARAATRKGNHHSSTPFCFRSLSLGDRQRKSSDRCGSLTGETCGLCSGSICGCSSGYAPSSALPCGAKKLEPTFTVEIPPLSSTLRRLAFCPTHHEYSTPVRTERARRTLRSD